MYGDATRPYASAIACSELTPRLRPHQQRDGCLSTAQQPPSPTRETADEQQPRNREGGQRELLPLPSKMTFTAEIK
jgi:hypothetical protein